MPEATDSPPSGKDPGPVGGSGFMEFPPPSDVYSFQYVKSLLTDKSETSVSMVPDCTVTTPPPAESRGRLAKYSFLGLCG